MYTERASRIPGAFVWSSVSDGSPTRVLPDGCMDLLWHGDRVTIAGPDTRAQLHAPPAGTKVVGLRFAPGFAPLVLGMPAAAFTDDDVALDAAWSRGETELLVERLASADDPGRVLEDHAQARAGDAAAEHRRTAEVATHLRRGRPVAHVADAVGLSARQLQRRCVDAFGYGPKMVTRVLRMVDALELARVGMPFAEVAAHTGYADQAHLARNVKALAGVPLRHLV